MNQRCCHATLNVRVGVERSNSEDGLPLFRAWILGRPMHARHGTTAQQAVDRLKQAYLQPLAVQIVVESTESPA